MGNNPLGTGKWELRNGTGTMDFEAESRRAQIEQFKRDRGPYVIGHVGATVFLIAIAWTTADHNSLLWFGVFHHIATLRSKARYVTPPEKSQSNLQTVVELWPGGLVVADVMRPRWSRRSLALPCSTAAYFGFVIFRSTATSHAMRLQRLLHNPTVPIPLGQCFYKIVPRIRYPK